MRRADRLLQIVQMLRRRKAPTTARALAEELEVGRRTIYRDIVDLQAARVPIDGAAGLGYILRPGYDLPPLMFTRDEIEAIVLGSRLVGQRSDAGLARAAQDVLAKIETILPADLTSTLQKATLLVPHPLDEAVSFGPHLPMIRLAIRHNRKLTVTYGDATGRQTQRTIWPLGLYLFSHVTLVCAWCELRQDYRAFRAERIVGCTALDATFNPRNGAMMTEFLRGFLAR